MAARTWDRDVCGMFNTVWLLSNACVPIFLLGIPTATLYFYPQRDNTRALTTLAGLVLLLSACLMCLFVYMGGSQVLYQSDLLIEYSHVFEGYLFAFLPYLFVQVAGGAVDSILIARERTKWQAILAIIGSTGIFSISLWGWWGDQSPTHVLGLMSLVGVLRFVFGYIILWADLDDREVVEFSGVTEFLVYTKTIAFNDTVGAISRSVDRFVVLTFLGASTFADYHFGAIEMPIALLLSAIASVLVPEFSRLFVVGELGKIRTLWQNIVSGMSIFVLPLCSFLLVFCDSIISIYLPPQYGASTWVFGVFLLMLPLRCAIFNPLLVGVGKASWAFGGSVIDLALNLCLSFLFVKFLLLYFPNWAFIGPAIATVIATYSQVSFLFFAISREFHWKISHVLPWKSILRRFVLTLVAALIARVIGDLWFYEIPILSLFVGVVSFLSMLFLVMYFSFKDREELRALVGMLRNGGKSI